VCNERLLVSTSANPSPFVEVVVASRWGGRRIHNRESSDEDKGKLSIVGCHVSINDVTERGMWGRVGSHRPAGQFSLQCHV
jgi:hypothetical protein